MFTKIKTFFLLLGYKIKELPLWDKLREIPRKTWIIIGSCTAGVIALVVATALLLPLFIGGGANGFGGVLGGGGEPEEEAKPEDDKTGFKPDLEAEVSSIYISAQPSKLVYYVGDAPNYDGLKVGIWQEGNDGFVLPYDEYYDEITITGFDSSAPAAEQKVTVQYKEFTTTFTVEIKARETGAYLASIKVDPLPIKTTYKLGEALDYTGGRILCIYSDETTKVLYLDDYGVEVSGFGEISTPGKHDIRVDYYDDKGGHATTTFEITMTE